jgi:hypothetical protein
LRLIINFNELKLTDDVSWLIIPGANLASVNRGDRENRVSSPFPLFPFVQRFPVPKLHIAEVIIERALAVLRECQISL